MAADLNPEVMSVLQRLLDDDDDLQGLSVEGLVDTLRALRQRAKLEGRAVAELHRRGWTWPQIAAVLSDERKLDQSTVQKWARQYRQADES